MQKTPSKSHRAVVFVGLAAAIALCALSGIAHRRVRPPHARSSVEELDARAKPHFDEAERNVPSVVAEMCSAENTFKLLWLMAKDKLSGSHLTRDKLASMIHDRIIVPCQRGAQVYGCASVVAFKTVKVLVLPSEQRIQKVVQILEGAVLPDKHIRRTRKPPQFDVELQRVRSG